MKKVYMLEVNCEYVGVYDTKEEAMIAGLSKYTIWLEGYANAGGHEYSKREIIEDLQNFISECYIEDYIYIFELPYYGSDDE